MTVMGNKQYANKRHPLSISEELKQYNKKIQLNPTSVADSVVGSVIESMVKHQQHIHV